MDAETNPANVTYKPPPLNSDQLNYLIWRYLQEAGFTDAAVKLQRDWKVDSPQGLPFAQHIKGQALVSLVQKGLRYHHLSLTVDENGQPRNLSPSMFFFGPNGSSTESTVTQKESLLKGSDSVRGVSPASTIANPPNPPKPKTRDTPSIPPEEVVQQPAKRGRKPAQSLSADRPPTTQPKISGPVEPDAINGHAVRQDEILPSSTVEHSVEDQQMTNGDHGDNMDIDNDANANPTDTEMEEQPEEPLPPIIPTLTHGESVAIQVSPAKVADLSSMSAVLYLDNAQSISHALWRPAETSTLVAQGETFCAKWDLAGQDLHPQSVKPMPTSLFPSSESSLITAAAWDTSGSVLAVATYSAQEGHVHLFDGQDFALIESLPASQRAITMLRWHQSGTQLIGVAPYEEMSQQTNGKAASTLLSWDLASNSGASTPSVLSLGTTILDLDCPRSDNSAIIYAAGENTVYQCHVSSQISINQHWSKTPSNAKDAWTFIRGAHLPGSGSVAVAAAAENATLWMPDREIIREGAHSGPITALELKPLGPFANGSYQSLEFATSSMDGSIKIWGVAEDDPHFNLRQQIMFESSSPVMSLSYSPDGFCLAGASYDKLRIWNAQHEHSLMATWEGAESDWRGASLRDDDLVSAAGRSSINGEGGPGTVDHTLAWHMDSRRMAFGLGSQVAVINFPR